MRRGQRKIIKKNFKCKQAETKALAINEVGHLTHLWSSDWTKIAITPTQLLKKKNGNLLTHILLFLEHKWTLYQKDEMRQVHKVFLS